jgi:hypothetical protein
MGAPTRHPLIATSPSDPPVRAHDWECAADVTVVRIPRGDFGAVPRYWDGSGWTAEAAAAVPVIPTEGRSVNATQVASFDDRFIAVTKVGDWWGDTVVLDVAPTPEGPWQTYEVVPLEPGCAGCNTYFASFVPFGRREGSITIGVSRNTWAGDDLAHYSPRFVDVPAPP